MFEKVDYRSLNARQKELFNFHKLSGRLIEHGYYAIKLSDDWQGADFLACHFNGDEFIKVQLKGKMTLDKRYEGKRIHIAFREGEHYFVYPHDDVMRWILKNRNVVNTESWIVGGKYHWPQIPNWAFSILEPYRI